MPDRHGDLEEVLHDCVPAVGILSRFPWPDRVLHRIVGISYASIFLL